MALTKAARWPAAKSTLKLFGFFIHAPARNLSAHPDLCQSGGLITNRSSKRRQLSPSASLWSNSPISSQPAASTLASPSTLRQNTPEAPPHKLFRPLTCRMPLAPVGQSSIPLQFLHSEAQPVHGAACSLAAEETNGQALRESPSKVLSGAASRFLHTSAYRRSPGGGGYMRTGHVPQRERHQRYLVTGACGQIGMELVPFLRERLGVENVVASDIKTSSRDYLESGPFVYADVRDYEGLARLVLENGIDGILHLASLLSAIGEKNPQLALKINTTGIQNVLELARQHQLRVYAPSSIAVFGPTTPKDMTPDVTVMEPTTMYGITKVHLELLGNYYARVYGVDFRSLRYPGVISARSKPGGGTTDYAVEIYHEALKRGAYHCFLDAEQLLPMMYMPDCLKATYELIHAPRQHLTQNVYNVTAMSFTPRELAAAIEQRISDFQIIYDPDFRQAIARTWPRTIDDSRARRDWNWRPDYDIHAMTDDMLHHLTGLYQPQDVHQSQPDVPATFVGR